MSERCEVPLQNASSDEIRDILKTARRIAVVGHSDDPARDSHRVGLYLASQGYQVFAVNPNATSIPGLKFYPLADNASAAKARAAGLRVVMSRCIMKEHRALSFD